MPCSMVHACALGILGNSGRCETEEVFMWVHMVPWESCPRKLLCSTDIRMFMFSLRW